MLVTELIRRGALYHGDRTALLFGEREHDLPRRSTACPTASPMSSAARSASAKGSPIAMLLDNGLHSVPVRLRLRRRRGWCARR